MLFSHLQPSQFLKKKITKTVISFTNLFHVFTTCNFHRIEYYISTSSPFQPTKQGLFFNSMAQMTTLWKSKVTMCTFYTICSLIATVERSNWIGNTCFLEFMQLTGQLSCSRPLYLFIFSLSGLHITRLAYLKHVTRYQMILRLTSSTFF